MGLFSLFTSKKQVKTENMLLKRKLFIDPLLTGSCDIYDYSFLILELSRHEADTCLSLIYNWLASNEAMLGIFLKAVEYECVTEGEEINLCNALIIEEGRILNPIKGLMARAIQDLYKNNRNLNYLRDLYNSAWYTQYILKYEEFTNALEHGFDLSAKTRFSFDNDK